MYAETLGDRSSPGLFGELRPVPHRKLKKFLNPAFAVSFVNKLDTYFKACISTLLDSYYTEVDRAVAKDLSIKPKISLKQT
ncbi:hypothetical protein G6011_09912 [Alternaria panax]|uniref:Uncharacterized protein n=1 Tax=Alternaria panax TaxID=48097 RepID=A0AAD4FAK7_9PLEO|nr:hypothetical protein G6011_09912 [Alternaria panax]